MDLALKEVWRAKLRFGLLAGAIALLVFLLLFLNTLSSALLSTFTGAIEQLDADVLVYGEDARSTLQASRLDPALVDEVADLDGVAAAAPLGLVSARADLGGEEADLSLFGFAQGEPGAPGNLVEGRLPGPGEIVVDQADETEGFVLGETIEVGPDALSLTIVGYTGDSRLNVGPTGWTTLDDWEAVVLALNPGAPSVPVNAVAVRGQGEDPVSLAAQITAGLDGVEALARDEAVTATPGVDSISQSFGLISGIGFAVIVLLVGFFFLILTVQKLKTFTALRAVGAPVGVLGGAVIAQIVLVVLAAAVIATALLAVALATIPIGLPATPDWRLIATVVAAVLVSSVVAGVISVRRIARLDPADVAQIR